MARLVPWTFPTRRGLAASLCVAMLAAHTFVGGRGHAAPPANASSGGFQRILFLGNSITLHGPAPDIGWTGNWGMAASVAQKDFVHLVAQAVAGEAGMEPAIMVRNIAAFERSFQDYDLQENMPETQEFNADLVILAIGENVPALESADDAAHFEARVTHLLQEVARTPQVIIVRSSFWPNTAKDDALRRACEACGGIFVDIGGLSADERNYARSERAFDHAGVAAHPGDQGMQAIADAIVTPLRATPSP